MWHAPPMRSSSLMHNAAHWRARAAEARRMAEEMPPGEGKDTLLGIANDYERLAKRAEDRPPGSP